MEGGVLRTSPRIIHWPIDCNTTAVRGWNPSFSILTMAHHDIGERVIALVEEGGLSPSAAGERYGIPGSTRAWLQKYRTDGQV
jgi:hypothetical protein